jgi:hypothetical protein
MTRLPATALTLGAALMLSAAGCSKVDKPRQTPEEAARAEQKAEPAAAAPAEPPKPEKKEEPPAKPAPVVEVRHVPADPTKWVLADLQAGLSNHDIRFIPAVVFFSLQHANDAQHANELKGLLETAGKMKDDPNPLLPLPAAPVATAAPAVPATIPVLPLPGTTAAGKPTAPEGRRPRRLGGGIGAGKQSE